MLKFTMGLVLGSVLTAGLSLAGDYLGRSEAQVQFDYFRERAAQLDIENIRKQQTEDKLRTLGKSPC